MDATLRAIMERVDEVERESFRSLYEEAVDLGAGWYQEGEVTVAWLGTYGDPGFSPIFDLAKATDPETTIKRMEVVVQAAGAKIIGIDTHPDLDPAIDEAWFAERGYEPAYRERIWWRKLGDATPQPEPEGVRIEQIDASDGETFALILNLGFEEEPDCTMGEAFRRTIGKPGWCHYLVFVDGQPGAASAMFTANGVADFFVASTIPEARQRGAQTALIQRRLVDGQAAGCDLATAQSVVYNASPRNFARQGFEPVYQRLIYAKSW